MINRTENLFIQSIIFLIATTFSTISVYGQIKSISDLVDKVAEIQDSIRYIEAQKDDFRNQFDILNKKIFNLKSGNEITDNPLKKIQLERALKESARYAEKIHRANYDIERLNKKLKLIYREIISKINLQINIDIDRFNSIGDRVNKIDIIEHINQLENEKSHYYKLLNEDIPTILIDDSSLVVSKDDNLRDLKLKKALINDRLSFLIEEEEYLIIKKEELNNDLSVYKEMKDFITDLRRGIDEDQEYFDPDKTEQINSKINEITTKTELIDERLKKIKISKDYYKRKLKEVNERQKNIVH